MRIETGFWLRGWLVLVLLVFVQGAVGCSRGYDKTGIKDPAQSLNTPNVAAGPDGREHKMVGKASWYGKKFHGRKTASGEKYDMYAFTAAHKTLPFHSVVRVTDPKTRKSVVVRVTDRGPFSKGRVIDLSYGAASDLGMIKAGILPVRIEVLQWGNGKRAPNS